ncbi:hypothetical protein SYNTR_1324 [Candidatus Syntrophocurvum alkaliphilum]|uniref:Uncharacterized protein n=1 Tax=Candidatus Syntrophocurvum alkaliphilum TaxID=2293317 RepID=A0A6I6DFT3_9FIRM|nr:hypothetical protein [Candidatus Syntrophocurvum alkaliphilum]QGT99917.1 hypothetical protein SYNTR_1324 [Candidatus Syntrophocurvum alkaliphilum]
MLAEQNIISQNSVIQSLSCPYPKRPSEVYDLGLSINYLNLSIFQDIIVLCKNTNSVEIINKIISFEKSEEQKLFKDYLFLLNIELGDFYYSGGLKISNSVDETEIEFIKPLIDQNLENLYLKVNKIKNDLSINSFASRSNGISELNYKDVFETCMSIRENISVLYHELYKIYPHGRVRDTFMELAIFTQEGSMKLRKICTN